MNDCEHRWIREDTGRDWSNSVICNKCGGRVAGAPLILKDRPRPQEEPQGGDLDPTPTQPIAQENGPQEG